jgi:hypothetical protein
MSAITATVQLRRDTAANWTANNPTLLVGEVGIETDTRRMKFGNGTQAWTALPYAQGTAAQNNTGDFDPAGSAAAAQAASQPINSACAVPIVPTMNSLAAAPIYVWAAQPAALTFFMGAGRWFAPVSLIGRTQARVHVVTAAIGTYVAGSKIRLLYRTQTAGYDSTIANWNQLGASAQVEIAFAAGLSVYSSAWINLATLAKDDVLIAVTGIDGNGTATPNFLNITFEYR